MAGLNKAMIIGHLGQDPEVRYTGDGTAVATVSVATSESWKDKQTGEKKEATEWHRCVLWGKLGEIAGQHLRKGAQVYMEGKLQTRKYEDREGITRYTTEIRVWSMQMLGKKGDSRPPHPADQQASTAPSAGAQGQPTTDAPPAGQAPTGDEPFDDDIPF